MVFIQEYVTSRHAAEVEQGQDPCTIAEEYTLGICFSRACKAYTLSEVGRDNFDTYSMESRIPSEKSHENETWSNSRPMKGCLWYL